MPKKVDHDARRREIADAVLRLVAAEGLEAVSLRHVAAEAGISMGAVQHYFRSKDEMLAFALETQARRREERIVRQLSAAGRPPTVRELFRVAALEVLPISEESRADYTVGLAYFIRALREPRIAELIVSGGPALHGYFGEQLAKAQRAGEVVDGVDVSQETLVFWSVVDSQSTAILLGERTAEAAVATVDYYLDRLFTVARSQVTI
ncbi:TetR/AcrR family transcriptional regulator [Pseudonocardia lacus]|uniref:TetR/AcrR family transcriptional regulator n=1 Tax=Pseudonocardia lacus TaxID=2835865 RepID=UPI001BDC26F5|nr:TetR family transcriptional regulator [Pseudonocardia lacus]